IMLSCESHVSQRLQRFSYTTLFRSRGDKLSEDVLSGLELVDLLEIQPVDEGIAERLTQIQVFLKEKGIEIDEKFAEKKRKLSTRSEEHTSELQSRENLVCRPLLEKK